MTNKASWDSATRSMEPTASRCPTVQESELYRSVQAVLQRELNDQQPTANNRGMLRWTLHKKVKNNPSSSLSLVWVLIKELEKAERWDSRKCIIPLLHTLMYAIIQTAYIPDELYKRIYDFCKRLITYPHPYCTVGLSYTRQIKCERTIPGLMYQRMVTAEQRLRNEAYPFQERIFVLADPEVFSGALGQSMADEIDELGSNARTYPSPVEHMRSVVQHSIQAALGPDQCQGWKLAQALKDVGEDVETYFQEVLATLEQSVEEGSRADVAAMRSRLQRLYSRIVKGTPSETLSEPLSSEPLCDCPLPNPEMSFHLWDTKREDFWRLVTRWVRSSSSSEQSSLSQEVEDIDLGESLTDMITPELARYSVMSNDSGIERDFPPNADGSWEQNRSDQEAARLFRRGGFKMRISTRDISLALMQDTLEEHGGGSGLRERRGATLQRRAGSTTSNDPFTKQLKNYTARVVLMGDDRVVGQLAKAYYFFRKWEARRPVLLKEVNLQFYYIPVSKGPDQGSHASQLKESPCTLGSYLSMVDPWYKCNINSLGSMIPKLAKLANPGKSNDPFISDVISYYIRTGQQPVHFSIYLVKMTFTSEDPVEDVFLIKLEMEFPEFRAGSASVRGKADRSRRGTPTDICGVLVSVNYKKVTLSGRDVDRGVAIMTTGAQVNAIPANEAEDLNCLTVTFNESAARTRNNSVESKIRTNNIKIRTPEGRPFIVKLDGDERRTYNGVKSMEISHCLDPGYCVQKKDKNAGLSKYMNKALPLPINTFAGIMN